MEKQNLKFDFGLKKPFAMSRRKAPSEDERAPLGGPEEAKRPWACLDSEDFLLACRVDVTQTLLFVGLFGAVVIFF